MGRAGSSGGSGGSRSSGSSGGSRSRGSSSAEDLISGGISGLVVGFIFDLFIWPLFEYILASKLRSFMCSVISLLIAIALDQNPPGDAKAWSIPFYVLSIICIVRVIISSGILSTLSFIICEYGAYYHSFVLKDICEPGDEWICFICLNIFITILFGAAIYHITMHRLNSYERRVEKKFRKKFVLPMYSKKDLTDSDKRAAESIVKNMQNQKVKQKKK